MKETTMPATSLIGEFHADHAKVIQALLDLRTAIEAQAALLAEMEAQRREGTTLLDYRRQRL